MFRFPHHKSGLSRRAAKDRNFVPKGTPAGFALCRPGAPARNGVTGLLPAFGDQASPVRAIPAGGLDSGLTRFLHANRVRFA